jgi:glycolate oxidase FAD binding subunit
VNTLEPATLEEAGKTLRTLRQKVLFVGGGTQLGLGPAPEVLFSTRALNRVVDYAPSDQVVTVEGGVTLAALQQELHKQGQRLSLDPPLPERATLGGIVAANSFGPLRTRFGSVRDLIIGVSILRADGTRAKGGGKVVKTVAGFDLPKLMCGSLGTLGLIATATFRVHPLPESQATLVVRALPAPGVFALVKALRTAQLEPAAMVSTRAGAAWEVAVRFEGFDAGVKQQREKLRTLGAFEDAAESVWAAHAAFRAAGDVRIKVAALPSQLEQVSSALPATRLCWYPTLGLGFAMADSPFDFDSARRALVALGGSLTVEAGPNGSAYGAPPDSLRVHQSMKARFDPQGLLAPGRFIGGI